MDKKEFRQFSTEVRNAFRSHDAIKEEKAKLFFPKVDANGVLISTSFKCSTRKIPDDMSEAGYMIKEPGARAREPTHEEMLKNGTQRKGARNHNLDVTRFWAACMEIISCRISPTLADKLHDCDNVLQLLTNI